MRRANLPVLPSLTIAKAKSIASSLSISETDFKASWQWLSRFRVHWGLQKMLLHGEGAEVNKSDPRLLAALDDLYAIIAQYDLENVYNMDETGLFFRLLLRYSLLMLDEDISTTRGKKKSKDRVSFIVCANAMGTHKIPCALISKPILQTLFLRPCGKKPWSKMTLYLCLEFFWFSLLTFIPQSLFESSPCQWSI